MTARFKPFTDAELGRWMLNDFVHRAMLSARATEQWERLAALPTWARRMIERIGQVAGLKSDDVRAVVGDD